MRLFITTISMFSVISFGYALAGYAGYIFGLGRPDYVIAGLILGFAFAAAAMYLWKKNLHAFLEENETDDTQEKSDE